MLLHSHEEDMGQNMSLRAGDGSVGKSPWLLKHQHLSSDLSTHSQCSGTEAGGLLGLAGPQPSSSFSDGPCQRNKVGEC